MRLVATNKGKVLKSVRDYVAALDKDIAADRASDGKKSLQAQATEPETKESKISTTDQDSG